jgi:hypothetical protein
LHQKMLIIMLPITFSILQGGFVSESWKHPCAYHKASYPRLLYNIMCLRGCKVWSFYPKIVLLMFKRNKLWICTIDIFSLTTSVLWVSFPLPMLRIKKIT